MIPFNVYFLLHSQNLERNVNPQTQFHLGKLSRFFFIAEECNSDSGVGFVGISGLLQFGAASQFCFDPHDIHIFENCKPIFIEHLSIWVCLMFPHIEVQVFRPLQEHQRSDTAF